MEEYDISDSSSECHPNIDKKSYKKWKRQLREKKKMEWRNKLEELNIIEKSRPLNNGEQCEKNKLIQALTPQIITKSEGFRTSEKVDEVDYYDDLINLVNDTSILNFIKVVEEKNIDWDKFEEFVLFNLSENIKDGNDGGECISIISMYITYLRKGGRKALYMLCDELQKEDTLKEFEDNVIKYYNDAKKAILELNKK